MSLYVSKVKKELSSSVCLHIGVVPFCLHPLCLRYPECKAEAWLESQGFRRSGGVTGSMNGSSDCGARSVFSTVADYQQMNTENKQQAAIWKEEEEPREFGPESSRLKFVLVSEETPPLKTSDYIHSLRFHELRRRFSSLYLAAFTLLSVALFLLEEPPQSLMLPPL